jgi:uncharacterized coiled-coil protein SlyX
MAASAAHRVVQSQFQCRPSRLVTLEGRVAQTEARIAAQDFTLLQPQQVLRAKDAQLAKIEEAIAALTKSQSKTS